MLSLKTCPFCGGEAELSRDNFGRYAVICSETDCGAVMAGHKNKSSVIQMWNRRNGEPLLVEMEDKPQKVIPIEELPSSKTHSNVCTIRETVVRLAEDGYAVSEHTLRIMVKTGQIPHLTVGNKALLSYSVVMEYLSSGDHTKPPIPAKKKEISR